MATLWNQSHHLCRRPGSSLVLWGRGGQVTSIMLAPPRGPALTLALPSGPRPRWRLRPRAGSAPCRKSSRPEPPPTITLTPSFQWEVQTRQGHSHPFVDKTEAQRNELTCQAHQGPLIRKAMPYPPVTLLGHLLPAEPLQNMYHWTRPCHSAIHTPARTRCNLVVLPAASCSLPCPSCSHTC